MRRLLALRLSLILPVPVLIWFLWGSTLPLGWPGEWTWGDRAELAEPWFLACIPAVISGLMYAGFVWFGMPRLGRCGAWERGGWLVSLAVAGFAWLCVVQEAAPRGSQLSKAGFVLYFPGPSGYFTQARYEVRDLREFLRNYNELLATGDVLHIGTHPPGLTALIYGLIRLCETSPQLTQLLVESQPPSVRETFDLIAGNATPLKPFRRSDRAVLWLAFLLVQGCAAAAVLPLYGLLRRQFPAELAWLTASLWATVPAVSLFIPKSDVLFAFWGVTLAWVWLEGCRRDSSWRLLLAGAFFWGGMLLSLAMLPIGILLAVASIWETSHLAPFAPDSAVRPWLKLARAVGVAATAFAVLCGLYYVATGSNLGTTWLWNYRNHARFYEQYTRSYLPWLLINPVEFAISAGLPICVLAGWGWGRILPHLRERGAGLCLGPLLIGLLLWLSGKNMGEAARLWTFLTPWLLFPAAWGLQGGADWGESSSGRAVWLRVWGMALACQMTCQVALVLRVVGFPLPFPVPTG